MNKVLLGAVAGFAATAPMSLAMKLMHERLPPEERYPLAPRAVTMEVAEAAGVKEALDETEREAATWVSHFAYGTACGAAYGMIAESLHESAPPALAGAGFGVAVWAGSYLGWLPAAGILRPATEHPARRTALMIAAHVIWGAAAGLILQGLSAGEEEEEARAAGRRHHRRRRHHRER